MRVDEQSSFDDESQDDFDCHRVKRSVDHHDHRKVSTEAEDGDPALAHLLAGCYSRLNYYSPTRAVEATEDDLLLSESEYAMGSSTIFPGRDDVYVPCVSPRALSEPPEIVEAVYEVPRSIEPPEIEEATSVRKPSSVTLLETVVESASEAEEPQVASEEAPEDKAITEEEEVSSSAKSSESSSKSSSKSSSSSEESVVGPYETILREVCKEEGMDFDQTIRSFMTDGLNPVGVISAFKIAILKELVQARLHLVIDSELPLLKLTTEAGKVFFFLLDYDGLVSVDWKPLVTKWKAMTWEDEAQHNLQDMFESYDTQGHPGVLFYFSSAREPLWIVTTDFEQQATIRSVIKAAQRALAIYVNTQEIGVPTNPPPRLPPPSKIFTNNEPDQMVPGFTQRADEFYSQHLLPAAQKLMTTKAVKAYWKREHFVWVVFLGSSKGQRIWKRKHLTVYIHPFEPQLMLTDQNGTALPLDFTFFYFSPRLFSGKSAGDDKTDSPIKKPALVRNTTNDASRFVCLEALDRRGVQTGFSESLSHSPDHPNPIRNRKTQKVFFLLPSKKEQLDLHQVVATLTWIRAQQANQ